MEPEKAWKEGDKSSSRWTSYSRSPSESWKAPLPDFLREIFRPDPSEDTPTTACSSPQPGNLWKAQEKSFRHKLQHIHHLQEGCSVNSKGPLSRGGGAYLRGECDSHPPPPPPPPPPPYDVPRAPQKTLKHKTETPPDIAGRVMELSKIQSGSRYLQRQLCRGHPQVVMLILREVEDHLTELMMDSYGNYLCQQLFQACSVTQRKAMLEKLAPHALTIATNEKGTHALQALIGLLSTGEEEQRLMDLLRGYIIDLAMDPHGTHVVQRVLICFSSQSTDVVFEPVKDDIAKIAQNPHGLCVVKRCITLAPPGSPHHQDLLSALCVNALDLVQSPYGNYAVQHAMESWPTESVRQLLGQFQGKLLQLSIQKFSSNVVEKCIEKAPPDIRRGFVDELLQMEKMSVLIQSSYGNYVIQKVFDLCDPDQLYRLQRSVRKNLRSLQNRRRKSKWEHLIDGSPPPSSSVTPAYHHPPP